MSGVYDIYGHEKCGTQHLPQEDPTALIDLLIDRFYVNARLVDLF